MIPEPFTLERIDVDWTRHKRTKAPKILPPLGGEVWRTPGGRKQQGRYYTRTTTLAKTIEDSYALNGWRLHRALVGIGQRPDYQAAAAALTIEDYDRDAREELAQACIEASGPSAALIGTMLHTFTERVDRGEPLGFVPEPYRELIEAWRRITAPLRFMYREVRTVNDALECAGTPDAFGLCELPDPDGVVDEVRVIDLKSGKIKYPGSMSCQLYLYAADDTCLYDPETGERRELKVNTRWGLIAHLKSDAAEPPGLYWLNLEHGRRGVELARPVREWRAVKPEDILRPALVEAVVPATPALDDALDDITDRLNGVRVDPPSRTLADTPTGPVEVPATYARTEAFALLEAIEQCITDRDLELLWTTAGNLWTDEHRARAAEVMRDLKARRNLERPRAALVAALRVADAGRLRALWTEHGGTPLWTDEHTAAAGARFTELEAPAA